MAEWKVLREKNNVDDDIGLGDLRNETFHTGTTAPSLGFSSLAFVEGEFKKIVVTFLNTDGNYVVGDRGSFSIQYLEVRFDRNSTGVIAQESIVVFDSIVLEGGIGFREMLAPDNSSVINGTVRLQNITPPVGATRIRIFYKGA